MKTIQVKVKPNARISILEAPLEGNIWRARLKSPPIDGKANQELVALVTKYFGCAKAQVSIKRGAAGRKAGAHKGHLKSTFLVQTCPTLSPGGTMQVDKLTIQHAAG